MPTSTEWLDSGYFIENKMMKFGLEVLRECWQKFSKLLNFHLFLVFSKITKTTQNIKGSPFEYIEP